jgi:hypothetical protein
VDVSVSSDIYAAELEMGLLVDAVEVLAGKDALKGLGDLAVAGGEAEQSGGERVESEEVIRGLRFASDDREMDLNLVQRPAVLRPDDAGLAGLTGAVVSDPEHPAGAREGLDRHDLVHEAAERFDHGLLLDAIKQVGVVNVRGGEAGGHPAASYWNS